MLLDAKREPAWSARDQSQPGAVRSFELPDACVARMHDLCWRPGDYMYASWWSALGLAEWHDTYRKLPACRASIDRVIVSRRGFPVAPLNSDIDDEGRRLLAMEPRLPALCAALGLIALDCDEHLLLGAYRQALRPLIGVLGCDQLLALNAGRPNGGAGVRVPLERIAEESLAAGVRWLTRERATCQVWRALAILLPIVDPVMGDAGGVQQRDVSGATSTLFRLDRFL